MLARGTTQMDLKDTMLSEASHQRTNAAGSAHTHRLAESPSQEVEGRVPGHGEGQEG